jgi:hypothetical protein
MRRRIKNRSAESAFVKARVRRIYRSAVLIMVFASTRCAVDADEKPADTVFEQSEFELTCAIPPSFKSIQDDRGYFPTPAGNVPFRVRSWRAKSGAISVKIMVMPEVWWQTLNSRQWFAADKQNLLSHSGDRLIAERDYSISGCPAHSVIFDKRGDRDEFR